MARVCEMFGTRTQVGNKVSHSNIKTKRRFYPNLQVKKIFHPEMKAWIRVKVTAKALKTINKIGVEAALRKAKNKGTLSEGLHFLLD